jgi:putative hydrolase of the HAD superfamily
VGGAEAIRAVIFDLWDTLVDFDPVAGRAYQDRVAERLGRDPEELAALWAEGRARRESGPLREYLVELGAEDDAAAELATLRLESTRPLLKPRPGALETLAELRRRGYLLGLITVCSEDVEELWEETSFAGSFDATVFSCSAGLRKPDPRIYHLACEQLRIEPEEAIFVGDGANDELAGAERVGMRAVLIHREGEDPPWDEVREWQGPRITTIPQLLAHLEA